MGSRHLALRIPHLWAQVETRLNPGLRDLAFVVATGREPRSQVLGLSPEACSTGGGHGAPVSAWLRRHPGLLVVVGRPERAAAALDRVKDMLDAIAPRVSVARPGLFLIDLGGSGLLHPDETELGRHLLGALRAGESLEAALGIGSTPLAAQLLARRARSGEMHVVCGAQERRLLDEFPLAGLPGLDTGLLHSLAETGIRRVGEARCLPAEQLRRLHGDNGLRLQALLRDLLPGRGEPVTSAPPLRAWRRLPGDCTDPGLLWNELADLLESLHGQARELGRAPLRLRLRLIWNDGQPLLRGMRLLATAGESRRGTLRRTGRELLRRSLEARRLRVRELEVEMDTEEDPAQLPLFTERGAAEQREVRLDRAMGLLRRRWGAAVVKLGTPAVAARAAGHD